jgi:putative SOS response-associated peptidase YedK
MCGKFTAMYSWREVYELSLSLTEPRKEERQSDGEGGGNDELVTYRVGGLLPVIMWNTETHQRRVVNMRWGFPDPRDWRRPRPIHGRFETIDPQDGRPRGFAFVWSRFEIPDLPAAIWACVMLTVPANELIRRTIKSQETDPRMPAILEDDVWSTWLGEEDAAPAAAKAVLKTMGGVNWQAAPKIAHDATLAGGAGIGSAVISTACAGESGFRRSRETCDAMREISPRCRHCPRVHPDCCPNPAPTLSSKCNRSEAP